MNNEEKYLEVIKVLMNELSNERQYELIENGLFLGLPFSISIDTKPELIEKLREKVFGIKSFY